MVSSYYHRFLQTIYWEKSPSQILLEQLNTSSTTDALIEAVSYLGDHRDTALESAVAARITHENLQKIVAASFKTSRLRMLDACQRIVSLDQFKQLYGVNDVPEQAKADALFTPPPPQGGAISASLSGLSLRTGIINQIGQYFVTTVTWSYGIDLNTPPKSRWEAQGQWMFFRGVIDDLTWIGELFLEFFSTTWRAALAGSVAIATVVGLKHLYDKFHIGTPDNLDQKYFRNLTTEAREGRIRPTVGRKMELNLVQECLSTPPGQQPRIPCLVGPAGCGKSQLAEGLAYKIAMGDLPRLENKKVFVVNTAHLSQFGNFSEGGNYTSRIDSLFQQIEGFEDQIILFFDEIHNATGRTDGPDNSAGSIIEMLKTKLLERKILAILATTPEEFEERVAPNRAFVDRITRIDLTSLPDAETKLLLKERAGDAVDVTDEGLESVLEAARNRPERANPRNAGDILQSAINYVWAWTPIGLDTEIEMLELACRELKATYGRHKATSPGWSSTQEGRTNLNILRDKERELQQLYTKRQARVKIFNTICRLRTLETEYQRREHEIIHLIGRGNLSVEAQKTYLFMQHTVLPAVRAQIQADAATLGEEMPLRVDRTVIEKLYPPTTSSTSNGAVPSSSHFLPDGWGRRLQGIWQRVKDWAANFE